MSDKKIRTGFYGKNAADCLNKYLSMLKKRISVPGEIVCLADLQFDQRLMYFALYSKAETAPDNEVILSVEDLSTEFYDHARYEIFSMPDGEKLKLLARLIGDSLKFFNYLRNSGVKGLHFIDGDFDKSYCLVDLLTKRRVDPNRPAALRSYMEGEPHDPFRTELEIRREREKNELVAEYSKAADAEYRKYENRTRYIVNRGENGLGDDEVQSMLDKCEAEYEAAVERLSDEEDRKLRELDGRYEKIIGSAGKERPSS